MLLRQIKERRNKRFVAVQAYTCPDIATAVVKAGFKLALCDVDYNTLRPRPETILVAPEDIAAVVLSNLYGAPDELPVWESFSVAGAFIIDDACQSALSSVDGVHVGQRTGWGVYSFGRGKAVSGVGGGAALFPRADGQSTDLYANGVSSLQEAKDLAYWIGFSLFSNPSLYGMVERIPFLNLGATEYKSAIDEGSISRTQLAAVKAKLGELATESESMQRNAAAYLRLVTQSGLTHPMKAQVSRGGEVVLIRYPLLASSNEARRDLLKRLSCSPLSCPPGYPLALADYPELRGMYEGGSLEASRQVAATLLTLPTHRGVTASMIERLGRVLGLE
jgi:dTDP-4-amino-4,6-dideoxygalactose transaminase